MILESLTHIKSSFPFFPPNSPGQVHSYIPWHSIEIPTLLRVFALVCSWSTRDNLGSQHESMCSLDTWRHGPKDVESWKCLWFVNGEYRWWSMGSEFWIYSLFSWNAFSFKSCATCSTIRGTLLGVPAFGSWISSLFDLNIESWTSPNSCHGPLQDADGDAIGPDSPQYEFLGVGAPGGGWTAMAQLNHSIPGEMIGGPLEDATWIVKRATKRKKTGHAIWEGSWRNILKLSWFFMLVFTERGVSVFFFFLVLVFEAMRSSQKLG